MGVYQEVQTMLDKTWKAMATRDRPCPKVSDKCKPTAGGCPCVQPGGDPGMPTGIRVRRILRVEDSSRWQRYLDCKESIKRKRGGKSAYSLTAKTSPHWEIIIILKP